MKKTAKHMDRTGRNEQRRGSHESRHRIPADHVLFDSAELATYAKLIIQRCKPAAGGCLEWTGAGANSSTGRGRVKIDSRIFIPYRVVAFAAGIVRRPEIQDNVKDYVLHECDNPKCCNTAHMKAGTLVTNMKDCVARGRHAQQRKVGNVR